MLGLFVCVSALPIVGWPSGEAPATFDFVRMLGAVVKVVADTVVGECAAAALGHGDCKGGRVLCLLPGGHSQGGMFGLVGSLRTQGATRANQSLVDRVNKAGRCSEQ